MLADLPTASPARVITADQTFDECGYSQTVSYQFIYHVRPGGSVSLDCITAIDIRYSGEDGMPWKWQPTDDEIDAATLGCDKNWALASCKADAIRNGHTTAAVAGMEAWL